MLQIIGSVVVIGCILGGFVAEGGHILALWHPFEIVIIVGSAIGAFLISNPMKVVKAAFAGAIAAVVVTYALGRSVGAAQMTGALVLAGVTMATFTAAVQTFVQQHDGLIEVDSRPGHTEFQILLPLDS